MATAAEHRAEIDRINSNIDAAFERCRELGATMPSTTNSDYLADTIETIPSSADIPVKTAADMTVSGATVTAPAGWYKQAASKAVPTATQATPSIEVNSSGLITAKATQSAGYVAAGTKSGTKQLTTQAAKTVTPTKSEQTVVPAEVYTTGAVKVAKIPDSYIQPTGTKSITENGTHDVKEYASVEVNVAGSGGGGGGGGVPTCTIKFVNEVVNKGHKLLTLMYSYVNANGIVETYYAEMLNDTREEIILDNVVCGSLFFVYSDGYGFAGCYVYGGVTDIFYYGQYFVAPSTKDAVGIITIVDDD